MHDGKRRMTEEEMIAEINRLINENASLKSKEYRIEELGKLCKSLQEQHQQDCIRYNNMRTAFLTAVDELAMLRERFGVGR